MDEQEIVKQIAFNVIQGRVEAEDEGIDQGLEGQPGVTELVGRALQNGVDSQRIVLEGLSGPMEEVGKKLGVTRERVRQIEAQALSRLRHPTHSRKLRDYLR